MITFTFDVSQRLQSSVQVHVVFCFLHPFTFILMFHSVISLRPGSGCSSAFRFLSLSLLMFYGVFILSPGSGYYSAFHFVSFSASGLQINLTSRQSRDTFTDWRQRPSVILQCFFFWDIVTTNLLRFQLFKPILALLLSGWSRFFFLSYSVSLKGFKDCCKGTNNSKYHRQLHLPQPFLDLWNYYCNFFSSLSN